MRSSGAHCAWEVPGCWRLRSSIAHCDPDLAKRIGEEKEKEEKKEEEEEQL